MFVGIEDMENWHGKPMGDKADAIVAHLQSLIKNNEFGSLKAPAPADDCPKVSMSAKLSEPPSYKAGEKVPLHVSYLANVAHSYISSWSLIQIFMATLSTTV